MASAARKFRSCCYKRRSTAASRQQTRRFTSRRRYSERRANNVPNGADRWQEPVGRTGLRIKREENVFTSIETEYEGQLLRRGPAKAFGFPSEYGFSRLIKE